MGTALMISLLAGLGIVLLLVATIVIDNRTQKPANKPKDQRTEDPRD